MWRKTDGSLCKFSVSQAYRDLIHGEDDVDWTRLNNRDHMMLCVVLCANMRWNDLVVEMLRMNNGNSVDSVIRRLCFAVSVYLIWPERNNRIFRDECKSIKELIKVLSDIVIMRLLSLKFKRSTAVIKAQERWDVKLCIVDTH
nr:reverse transcriptase zinc-binding domain-containing protein [Tanacetum cinerariifolium]